MKEEQIESLLLILLNLFCVFIFFAFGLNSVVHEFGHQTSCSMLNGNSKQLGPSMTICFGITKDSDKILFLLSGFITDFIFGMIFVLYKQSRIFGLLFLLISVLSPGYSYDFMMIRLLL